MKYFRVIFAATLVAIVAVAATLVLANRLSDKKGGWFAAGSKPASYDMGITSDEHHSGTKCAYIKSKDAEIDGFGTYMQTAAPGEYLDKNVRMTGWIKTKDVKDWVGMWMRVDGQGTDMLAFDNMQDRPITGTTDWKKYEIVLDVPKGAKDFAFGVLLSGTGQVYFDDVSFEVLGPAKGKTGHLSSFTKPENLDFEH